MEKANNANTNRKGKGKGKGTNASPIVPPVVPPAPTSPVSPVDTLPARKGVSPRIVANNTVDSREGDIRTLLESLTNATTVNARKRIRRALRAKGHYGGRKIDTLINASPLVPVSPVM